VTITCCAANGIEAPGAPPPVEERVEIALEPARRAMGLSEAACPPAAR
jgi:hypothetical protein